jgi:hypothetical protein
MDDDGVTHWKPAVRAIVERLVARLRSLPQDAPILISETNDDESSTIIARISLVDTGEVLAQFDESLVDE